MRLRYTLYVLTPAVLIMLLPLVLLGDVIYLKDGNVLVVEKAWEEEGVVKYHSTQGVQSLPRSSVIKIKTQQAMPAADPFTVRDVNVGGATGSKPPAVIPLPSSPVAKETVNYELITRLRAAALAEPANPTLKLHLAGALNVYASLRILNGDYKQAKDLLLEAYKCDKSFRPTLIHLAVVHYQTGDYRLAENLLLEALKAQDNDSYSHYLLGEVYYAQDQVSAAIREWETALRQGADPSLEAKIKKAKNEAGTHSELGELHSLHFILRYDRQVSDYNLGEKIQVTLEQLYGRLTSQLFPDGPATITVILYTQQAYFDITKAPRWSGALFDGKLRIPAKGVYAITPELESVLLHELTHCFLHAACQDRCPAWFHEGVAQYMEGKNAASHKKLLAELSSRQQLFGLKQLGAGFMNLSPQQATVAYIEGLSAVEFLVEKNGATILQKLAGSMRQNYTFDQALQATAGKTTAALQTEWEDWLKK
jgi:tetratricopeptide (TPR) repeat protein